MPHEFPNEAYDLRRRRVRAAGMDAAGMVEGRKAEQD